MSRPPITTVWDEKTKQEVALPTKWEICDNCRGNGTHVNPSIDGHGISTDDECWQDDDFREGYFSGRYDVRCDNCNGSGKVQVPDEARCTPEQLEAVHQAWRERAEYEAECAAERRMGA